MIKIQKNIHIAPYTTFAIGGPADFFTRVYTQENLFEALAWSKEKSVPFFLLGCGANILVGDKGFRGLIIKNEAKKTILQGTLLTVESGAIIGDIITYTMEKGLSGLEHFAGIPSTVGGALWQNLHFLTPERDKTFYIGDLLTQAKIIQENGTVAHVHKDYFQFTYDWSILHTRKDIVLDATFELTKENPGIIAQRFAANIAWREEKHPEKAIHSSAGSIFKKIEGYGAGRLIEQVGLKGKRVGGAKISEKHANFILNEDHASAADVRELIHLVQKTVKDKLGLELITEINFIGEF